MFHADYHVTIIFVFPDIGQAIKRGKDLHWLVQSAGKRRIGIHQNVPWITTSKFPVLDL